MNMALIIPGILLMICFVGLVITCPFIGKNKQDEELEQWKTKMDNCIRVYELLQDDKKYWPFTDVRPNEAKQ